MSVTSPEGSGAWWLRLQLGLGLGGGVVWLLGTLLAVDFVAGVGLGIVVGALALRFGRVAASSVEPGESS